MPIEEIGAGLLAGIARLIAWLFLEICFQFVCRGIGWMILKGITLGKYPTEDSSSEFVAVIGLLALLGSGIVLFYFSL